MTDSETESTPDPADTPQPAEPAKRPARNVRPWLFLLLLLALIALLATRPDLRRQAADSAATAVRTVAFDGLGLSPRQLFVWRLRIAGLEDSPLGQRWRNAVERASKDPTSIGRRYRTDARFSPDTVEAHVYDATLDRGEQIVWRLTRTDTTGGRLYASLERRSGDGDWSTVTELTADGERHAEVVDRDGRYRIVLQPELFAAVNYSLATATGGSLDFPVEGGAPRDIGSGFGAPRDGGSRAHHGVDIFADRGTPVTAVTAGRVRTGTGGIGGNHIWLSGGVFGIGGARYYYAHLDSFEVESGDRVDKGQVIGHVGNTGNARTTPPHLHFGIYTSGGPVNPAPFLKPVAQLPGAG
ncbi:M23 family metallopeptidase [Salinisphaera aquimarina]|uniref:M23 family metallopeptidase n=1 Tax=Salinisphaera aquimarina TaxID=2094031 RepID=A0ABV7EPZ9_9GAMM